MLQPEPSRTADSATRLPASEGGTSALKMSRPSVIIRILERRSRFIRAPAPVEAYDKNITYRAGRCPARYYIDRLIPLFREKTYDIASIISHRLPLSEVHKAVEVMGSAERNKIVIEP